MGLSFGLGLPPAPKKGVGGPAVDIDFAGGGALPSGWAFTRSGAGTALNQAGVIVPFATGVPRITDRGLLAEQARTNVLLNSAALSTQSVTTTATAFTLSFYGTGTVTLSGTSTAGPLVGTGANNRVTLTFTPTAGSLTLTVTGSVTSAQLETGTVASSYIPTTGAAATRGIDQATVTIPAPIQGTMFADVLPLISAVPLIQRILLLQGAAGNLFELSRFNNEQIRFGVTTGSVAQATIDSAINATTTGTPFKVAAVFGANNFALYLNGALVGTDTSGTVPVATALQIGHATQSANAEIRRVRFFTRAMGAVEAQALTT